MWVGLHVSMPQRTLSLEEKKEMWKRTSLAIVLVAAVLAAACSPAPTPPAVVTEPPSVPVTEQPTAGGDVEVFSWWTAGGEADGLAAMQEIFAAEHPEFTFVNAAVAGGAGTNARAVLATRLSANDPPSSWQGHAGQELIGTYVAAGQIQPLNDLYDANGWLDVMPETLIPLISQDGNIYSVPVNIHRANVMWYNPAVLAANSITVPTTWDEFFTAAETLQAAGVTPLAMGEAWTSMHLFETVLLGSLGADGYNALWDGSGDWGSAEVTSAIEAFSRALDYTNSDASTLTWDQAAQLVVDGDAAFTIMGDWAEGFFKGLELAPMEGFGWAPAPGTDGEFQFLSDSFVLPVGASNLEGSNAWLITAGSKAGQEAFNPIKGSICARTDCDPSLFDEYLQSAMQDWTTDTVVGSLTHGVVANDNWKAEINTALGLFLADRDVAAFQSALVAACSSSGACM
jgi:glucose/mannose transport system substrate-binding protein